MGTGMSHNQKSFLIAGIIITGILIAILFCGCIEPEKETGDVTNNPVQNTAQDIKTTPSIQEPSDIIIKVVKFEPARPCQSCANIGDFAKETIELHFPEDYKSGRISYETVNFQDPGNMDMARKYGIRGSSLYITVIKDGKEEIMDANDMWGYVWNKEEYINVFQSKLDALKKEN
ncbi:MAG: nitrophenyl compound nitroreductase subunit ArsF family protein [Halobacteriota archaeon]